MNGYVCFIAVVALIALAMVTVSIAESFIVWQREKTEREKYKMNEVKPNEQSKTQRIRVH